jgi:hypothetical protein
LMPIDRLWLPLSENPDHCPQRTNRQPADAFEDTACELGVWNCQIMDQISESQLFTCSWFMYHQWLSNIEVNQKGVFSSASCPRINHCFTAGKRSCYEFVAQLGETKKKKKKKKTTIFTSIFLGAITKPIDHSYEQ